VTDDEPDPSLVRQFRERLDGVFRAVGDGERDPVEAPANGDGGDGETELRLRFPARAPGRHAVVASVHPDEDTDPTTVDASPADDPDAVAFLGVPRHPTGATATYGEPDLLVPMSSATAPPDDPDLVTDARTVVAACSDPPTVVVPAVDPDGAWADLADAVRDAGATVADLDGGDRLRLGPETTVEQLHGWGRNAVNVAHRGVETLAAPEDTWLRTVPETYERVHDEPYRPGAVSVGDATGPDAGGVDPTAVDDIARIDEAERLRLAADHEAALADLTAEASVVAAGDELGVAALAVLRDNGVEAFLDAATTDERGTEAVVRVADRVQPHHRMPAVAGRYAEMSADRRVGWLQDRLSEHDDGTDDRGV
jgi:hypothetical protein